MSRAICLEKDGNTVPVDDEVQTCPLVMSGAGIEWERSVLHGIDSETMRDSSGMNGKRHGFGQCM